MVVETAYGGFSSHNVLKTHRFFDNRQPGDEKPWKNCSHKLGIHRPSLKYRKEGLPLSILLADMMHQKLAIVIFLSIIKSSSVRIL